MAIGAIIQWNIGIYEGFLEQNVSETLIFHFEINLYESGKFKGPNILISNATAINKIELVLYFYV